VIPVRSPINVDSPRREKDHHSAWIIHDDMRYPVPLGFFFAVKTRCGLGREACEDACETIRRADGLTIMRINLPATYVSFNLKVARLRGPVVASSSKNINGERIIFGNCNKDLLIKEKLQATATVLSLTFDKTQSQLDLL
jgi:hypothetical protein